MIRFFKKIRYKLFIEKKLGKYPIYALGEILITSVGILLAIQVNNWNQQRLANVKIERLLIEIYDNLRDEIEVAERIIAYYEQRDSVLIKVINKDVNRKDFLNPDILTSPQYANAPYSTMAIDKNAYESLIGIVDQIPVKYDPLFSEIKVIYEYIFQLIQNRENKLLEKIYPYQDYLRRNMSWYSEWFTGKELSKDAIDYFLKDPFHINWVLEFQDDAEKLKGAVEFFQIYALEVTDQIQQLKLK